MNIYILYILILQRFLNNRHDVYALFHLKQTNKLLYQLSLNINVKINDILKKYFSRSNIYIWGMDNRKTHNVKNHVFELITFLHVIFHKD
jgi:hypothetical protein